MAGICDLARKKKKEKKKNPIVAFAKRSCRRL